VQHHPGRRAAAFLGFARSLTLTFIGYRAGGLAGVFWATDSLFLPTCLSTCGLACSWGRRRTKPWILAAKRALAPLSVGLMAASVYTVGRAGVTASGRRSSPPARWSSPATDQPKAFPRSASPALIFSRASGGAMRGTVITALSCPLACSLALRGDLRRGRYLRRSSVAGLAGKLGQLLALEDLAFE